MKLTLRQLTLSLIILLLCSISSSLVFSQSLADHSNGKKVLLVDFLMLLKKDYSISFLYEPQTIEGIYVSTDIPLDAPLSTILKKALSPIDLKFKKVGKHNYIIKPSKKFYKKTKNIINKKPKSSYSFQKTKSPTTQKIKGSILNANDQSALIGATVQIKGTAIGTTSDQDGNFQLEIPSGQQTLVFSYIGFDDKEININGSQQKRVFLKEASTDLTEVIVTAIGIETEKRKLAYAADHFNMDKLSQSSEPNFINLLAAQSPGVWVNSSSGSPGASSNIFVRGMRSINGSNSPLFILDGIPIDNKTTGNGTGGVDVSNRLIDLNNHDIEKVSILKGAAATALYGIRAANGAIIITSKKGQKGKPKINFSSTYGINAVNKLPPRQNIYAQGQYKNGKAQYFGPESNISSSFGPPISSLEYDGAPDYPYDSNGRLVALGTGNGQPAQSYDAYNTFFVKGQLVDNHLSISGGTNWFDYYLSLGQFRETGVVPQSSFERYSFKGSFQVRLHEKLTMGMSTSLVHSNGYRMKRGSQFSGISLGLFRNPISFDIGNGLSGRGAANNPKSYIFENGTQRAYRGNGRYDNPFWSVNRNPFEDDVNRLIQNVHFNYQITPSLKASYRTGIDIYTDTRNNTYDINSGSHRNGQIELFDIQSTKLNSDFLLTFVKSLSKNWHFESTLGHNFYSSQFSLKKTKGNELEKQGIFNISNALQINTEESLLRKKLMGVYADLHWRYKNILYLNLTGRNDWSSTLPKNNNSFFYPSANIGFEFTELLGWTDSPHLSYGKLRFSVSQVGNDAGTYLTDTYFGPSVVDGDDLLPGTTFPSFGVSAFERSGILGNNQLKPESSNSYELGLDLKWLKARSALEITWYKTLNKNQIINVQLSAATGYYRAPTNIGVIKNQGIEILFKTTPIRSKNFQWDASINFSSFESIVSNLPQNNQGIVLASYTNLSSMIIEGQPYGVLVGTSIKRNEQGHKIIGQDGFPIVNETQTIIGDPSPDWLMGIQNNFKWKQFSFNALLDIRKGGDVWNGTRGVMSYLGISKISGDRRNIQNYIFEGVSESGEPNTIAVDLANPANGMQSIYWRRYGFIGLAEDHIEDASWVRLRQLQLAYEFTPKRWRQHPMNFKLSLNGHNLILLTKYTGVDPETNLRGSSNIIGWDYFNMPNTRGWSIQLNANF